MDDIRFLIKIATLYYKVGITQQEVADRFGISRQTCGRYLKRAEELGIVKIEIKSNSEYETDLEYRLEEAFGLREAVVIDPPADTEESLREALGKASASFLERSIKPNDTIAVSWSSTILQCARLLSSTEPRKVSVVQMNGSLDRTTFSTRAEFILEKIAQAFGGSAISLVAPMYVDNSDIKNSIMTDSRIAATLDLASKAQVALFGVGNISKNSSLYKAGYLNDAMLNTLEEAGAVGDICGRFFNTKGDICVPEFDGRTIAVNLESLRSKRLSVGVAAGLEKVDAIRGMLTGKYCNVLITDKDTAEELISGKTIDFYSTIKGN